MPDLSPGMARATRFSQEVGRLEKALQDLQMEMISNQAYLRKGAHTRLNKYVREYDKIIKDYEALAEDYDANIPLDFYREGVNSIGGKNTFAIPKADQLMLQELANASQSMHRAQIAHMRKEVRRFGNDIRKEKKGFKWEIKGVPTWNEKAQRYLTPVKIDWRPDLEKWIHDHRIRGIRYANGNRVDLVRQERLNFNAVRGKAYNAGRLTAMEKEGHKYAEVSDGDECGWSYHDDPNKANGLILTIEEARTMPLSHPYCQRGFHPTDKKPDRGKRSKGRAAIKAAEIAAAVIVAAEASNLAVQAIQRAAASESLARMQDELRRKGMETGDPRAYELERRVGIFRNSWTSREAAEAEAMVHHLYAERVTGFQEVVNQQVLQATGTEGRPLIASFMKRELSSVASVDTPTFAQELRQEYAKMRPQVEQAIVSIPKRIGRLEHDIHLMTEAWTRGYLDYHHIPAKMRHYLYMTEGKLSDRFSIAARMLKNQSVREMGMQEFRNLISYEQRIKRYQQLEMFSKTPARSAASFRWTKWGPRMKVDLTEWFRLRNTFTPPTAKMIREAKEAGLPKPKFGMISSLTVAPKRALRGTIKMFQDGNIGGSLSLVPKGIFRAIVEVDDLGRVTGNIRLVPGGPIRLRMEFETPRPPNWQQLGLIPGKDFVDWRARQAAAAAQGLSLAERIKAFDLHGAMHDLRQMQLKRIVVDLRVLNTDVVKISGQMRIPLKDVKEAVREGIRLGQLQREAGGGITGLLTIPFERGLEEFRQAWSLGEVSSTIYGDISFAKPVLHGEIKPRVHLNSQLIQDITVNMRIRGYTIADIANVLEMDIKAVQVAVQDGLARSRMFLNELGMHTLLDVKPLWDARVNGVMVAVPWRDRNMNRADIISKTLDGFATDNLSQAQSFSVRFLAGIDATDSAPVIELKLRSMIAFMKQNELTESEAIAVKLDNISKVHIRNLATKLSRENVRSLTKIGKFYKSGDMDAFLKNYLSDIEGKMIVPSHPNAEIRMPHKDAHGLTPTVDTSGNFTITHLRYDPANHRIVGWEDSIFENDLSVDDSGNLYQSLLVLDDGDPNNNPIVLYIKHDGANGGKIISAAEAEREWAKAGKKILGHLPREISDLNPDAVSEILREVDFMRQRFPTALLPDLAAVYQFNPKGVGTLGYYYSDEHHYVGIMMGPYIDYPSPIVGHGNYEINKALHDEIQRNGHVTGMSYGQTTIIHEMSHHLHNVMEDSVHGHAMLLGALSDVGIKLPKDIEGWDELAAHLPKDTMRAIRKELGYYPTTNYWELIAEAERHYLTDARPGPIAKAVGEAMDSFYNWEYGVNIAGS